MEINIKNFDSDGLLQEVIHLATKQAPYGSDKILNHIVDSLFFPNEEVDPAEAVWDKIEKRVDEMMDHKIDDAVQRVLGQMASNNVIKRLRNFGNLFRQLNYIKNTNEKKFQLILLTNEANNLLADITNMSPNNLLKAAELLKILAASHIATLMSLKLLEPWSYKHQSSLNNMAILYSDTAANMYNASMAWRRSMIAEGKGALKISEMSPEKKVGDLFTDKKIVVFSAYDKYTGEMAVYVRTPPIPKGGGNLEYGEAETNAYKQLSEYDEEVQKKFTETWNKALLSTTQQFMLLVDWPGLKKEQKGKLKKEPNLLTFPLVPSQSIHHSADALDRIDLFLEQQMDQFQLSGPRYVQTYRPPTAGFPGDHHMVYYRGDTYDTSMACIYFLVRGDLQRACDLGDGLIQAMNHDPIGEGRIVAATYADRLIDKDLGNTTSIYIPDGGRRDIGNISWAGIALSRLYHQTKKHRYLHGAEIIGQWILTNCSKNDDWKGFTGGEDHWQNKQEWRSVEHNTDCVSFFDNLFQITGKEIWKTARESARTLVKACLINNNYYVTGTGTGQDLNKTVVPTDCQSWVSLARVNPETDLNSLMYMYSMMETKSKGFVGTKFALAGSEIQNEATAGAAMALWFARQKSDEFEKKAVEYIDSLTKQITEAPNSIGYGVVATPAEFADTGEGLGWKYFNYLHVASTAWTGLAILGKENEAANPYVSLEK